MGTSLHNAQIFSSTFEQDAVAGDPEACFDLGVAYSCGAKIDLIEAHKWFNLAALGGYAAALTHRADIAEEMTAREIGEAQRRARAVLASSHRRAA